MSYGYRKTIKRDKTDILFSELVRERVNWICEYCGRDFSHNKGAVHCSHLFGRRAKSVRWHPQNAFCHCYDCHRKLEENPVTFAEWAREKLGQQAYDKLRVLANKPMKWTKWDKEYLHKHYLAERKRQKKLRMDGDVGRVDFDLC